MIDAIPESAAGKILRRVLPRFRQDLTRYRSVVFTHRAILDKSPNHLACSVRRLVIEAVYPL